MSAAHLGLVVKRSSWGQVLFPVTNIRINRDDLYALWVLIALPLFIILSAQCGAEADDRAEPQPPYSVEKLRAWHKSIEPWPWLGQPEQQVKLRSTNDHELLLAVSGNARGGTYILFARTNNDWSQISEEIEQAHHPLHVLETEDHGWHDFESFVPAWGSGGAEVWVFTYGWSGKRYVLKQRKDGRWCDLGPFKTDKELCPDR